MQLVRVADCISDIFYGQFCGDQELYCLAHPEIYQEFLRADSKILPEDLPKIIAVDLTGIRVQRKPGHPALAFAFSEHIAAFQS